MASCRPSQRSVRWLEACYRTVASHATGYTVAVEKSTLPVRTAVTVKAILPAAQVEPGGGASPSFAVLSKPEFLAEGTAIADIESPIVC